MQKKSVSYFSCMYETVTSILGMTMGMKHPYLDGGSAGNPLHGGGIVPIRGKADILAIPFSRIGESSFPGNFADFGLLEPSQREQGMGKLVLGHAVEKITLVL